MPTEDLKDVLDELVDIGFKKRKGFVLTLGVAPGVLGWLGLNRATKHHAAGAVEVSPVVGVRFEGVEQLVAECRGVQSNGYVTATISSPLGYLMPDGKSISWTFSPLRTRDATTDMVAAIVRFGIPFMRSVVSLDQLRQRLDQRFGHDHQLICTRPAAALLAGDAGGARLLIDSALAALGERTDLAAESYRRFADAFRARLLAAGS